MSATATEPRSSDQSDAFRSPSVRGGREVETSLFTFLTAIIERRRFILTVAVAAALVTAGVLLVRGRSFTSTASFVPQTRRPNASQLTGLAAQLGVQVGGLEPGQSPQFFADLAVSRRVLLEAARTTYDVPARDGTRLRGNLIQLLDVKGRDAGEAEELVLRKLQQRAGASASARTGVVFVRIWMQEPALAEAVLERILELVGDYNVSTRQSQARAERQFTERRLAESRAELRAAEERLSQFVGGNRAYVESASLRFQQERLEREVSMRQQVYQQLAQSFEQARIEEVRDTPVLSLVEPPRAPAVPDPRGLVLKSALALIVGATIAIALVLLAELWRWARTEHPATYERFEESVRGAFGRFGRRRAH